MRSGIYSKCPLAATVLLLSVPGFVAADNAASSTDRQGAESATLTSSGQEPAPSDREKARLRGPVEECTEEQRYGEGSWKMVYETKYGPDGRVLQRSYTNNDGTKGLYSFTYDAEGHLLRAAWTGQTRTGQTGSSDAIYNYDSEGRLTSITGQSDWTATFQYNDQGWKTRIVKSNLSTGDLSTGVSIGLENTDLFAVPPPGGWVTTSFNEREEAIESRIFGSDGQLLSRMTRSYDDKGRVTESTHVIESSEALVSPTTRERLRPDSEVSEKLEAAIAQFLGPGRLFVRNSYVYDGQGRVSETHQDVGTSGHTITKISYNDHGDEAQHVGTTSRAAHGPEESVVNVSYQYDSFDNWTEKITSSASTANEPPKTWTIEHRTITYY
jgi:YD repeat-containing protein